jgi:hypothetical protein
MTVRLVERGESCSRERTRGRTSVRAKQPEKKVFRLDRRAAGLARWVPGEHNILRAGSSNRSNGDQTPLLPSAGPGAVSVAPFFAKIIASSFAGCVWLAFFDTWCVAPGCS